MSWCVTHIDLYSQLSLNTPVTLDLLRHRGAPRILTQVELGRVQAERTRAKIYSLLLALSLLL
jgi:hypothetical protein